MPHITINIDFEWYPWTAFRDLASFQKHRARGPLPSRSGVYEIRRTDTEEVLFVGSSTRLTRLYNVLFQGSTNLLAASLREEGEGDLSLLAIRWAEIQTWYTLAVEYQLLQQYVRLTGRLPKYVRH